LIDILLLGIRLLRVQPLSYDEEDSPLASISSILALVTGRSALGLYSSTIDHPDEPGVARGDPSRQIWSRRSSISTSFDHTSPLNSRGRSITRFTMLQVDLGKEAGGRPFG
jgi:hypothetical protein